MRMSLKHCTRYATRGAVVRGRPDGIPRSAPSKEEAGR